MQHENEGGGNAGVLRITVNSSVGESEGEDSGSMSSYCSSIHSPYSSKPGSRMAHPVRGSKIVNGHSTPENKKYYRADPIEVSTNGEIENGPININRTISMSTLSLNESAKSASVTAKEIRAITNNYQALLNKATNEIRNLSSEKARLEKEMDKLLHANLELATESKKLLEEQREWRAERSGLMKANKEFVEEVERLYRQEESWEVEKQKLDEQIAELQGTLLQQNKSWKEEKNKLDNKIDQLVDSVKILTFDNDKLIQEKELERNTASRSSQEIKDEFEQKVIQLEATISNLQSQLQNETAEREKVEIELENLEVDLQEKKAAREKKFEQVRERNEKLSAQLFELQVSKDNLSRDMEELKKQDKRRQQIIDQLKVEKEWLVSKEKQNKGGATAEEVERLRDELKQEKEKVTNLLTWKDQLALKNKDLQMENKKLQSRADDLEALMNDEVTDINELLTVINNIQGSGGSAQQFLDPAKLKRRNY